MDTGFAWKCAPEGAQRDMVCEAQSAHRGGLLDGTLVATVSGWRRVENLRLGDLVMTLDCGPVRLLARELMPGRSRVTDPVQWPRLVPAGVLGNRAPMRLAAGQGVLLETPHAEPYCGDRFALLPIAALDGYRGIAAVPPAPQDRVWRLRFAQPQVVCVEGDALLHCPADPAAERVASRLAMGVTSAFGSAISDMTHEPPLYRSLGRAATAGLLRALSCSAL